MLELYGEPSWNNPIVRFFGPSGRELLPRKDRVWTSEAVSTRMIAALEGAGRDVPPYLKLAHQELMRRARARAVFAMHCFWKGEAVLGGQPGVLATRVGWLEGREVVEVDFAPEITSYETLVEVAAEMKCADRVFATTQEQLETARGIVGDRAELNRSAPRDARASDQRYHLKRSRLDVLPMTPLQATRVNSALEAGRDPSVHLSPEQRGLLAHVERACEKDPEALNGLERPEALAQLPLYADELKTRLGL